jgi:hypothetical protein
MQFKKNKKTIEKNSEKSISSNGVCIIDNKFENLYSGGIRWFTQDLAVDMRKSFDVHIFNLDSMLQDWPWIRYFPRKLKIIFYDLLYFAWKLKKISPPIKIVLPYHDCRIPKSFWSITEIFVHDDSILKISPRGLTEKAVVTYYRLRLRRLLTYKGAQFSTVSEDSAVRLNKILGLSFRVQYNSIDAGYFDLFCTDKYLTYKNRINFLYSGGFHYRKNFEFACQVVVEYARLYQNTQVHFYITGEVPRNSISKMSNRKINNLFIEQTGILQTDSLVSLYRQCHVNLYPTENEGFGRVVPESILSLCVVATQPLPLFEEIAGNSHFRVAPASLSINDWIRYIDQKLNFLLCISPLENKSQIENYIKLKSKGV